MDLILFFNGWGMRYDIIKDVKLDKNMELICLDYPYETKDIDFKKYNKIYAVGWSFGVYYLSQFLLDNPTLKCKSIAINATPFIIGQYGISKKIFKLTIDTLSLDNLKKFYLNMGYSGEISLSTPTISQLKEELIKMLNIDDSINDYHTFDAVFLGEDDRIIPFNKQYKFYKNQNTKIILLKCGHYPFDILTNWRKIIDEK